MINRGKFASAAKTPWDQMYNKTVLDNGIRVVSEEISQVRSVSIGVWVLCGARYEEESCSGICHFLEHMLFKGTAGRTAYDIACAVDSIGGLINAFTSKEITAYYLKIPDYHLPTAVNLLADMFSNSLFDKKEIEKEKSVIVQEINLLEDSPDDYVHEYFETCFWPDQPLGRTVLGSRESVENISRGKLVSFLRSRYGASNMVISAVGNLKHEVLVSMLQEAFVGLNPDPAAPRDATPVSRAGVHVLKRDLEQVHLVVGTDAPSALSPRRHAAILANVILGGCMSSRLFQEIRENRGLAYAVHSFISSYFDTGIFGIYVGASGDKIPEIIRLINTELDELCQELVTEREIASAKELIKGNHLLSMESTDSRMTRLAKNEACFGRYIAIEEFIAQIDQVSREDIQSLARDIFGPGKLNLVALGDVRKEDLSAWQR